MAEPTDKSPEIDDLLGSMYGRNRRKTIEADICVLCGHEATRFKDNLSVQEYRISGMCQKCQDGVFT